MLKIKPYLSNNRLLLNKKGLKMKEKTNFFELVKSDRYVITNGSFYSKKTKETLFLIDILPLDTDLLNKFGIDKNSKVKEISPLNFEIKTNGTEKIAEGVLLLTIRESSTKTTLSKEEKTYLDFLNQEENLDKLLKGYETDNVEETLKELIDLYENDNKEAIKNINKGLEKEFYEIALIGLNMIARIRTIGCFYVDGEIECRLSLDFF